MRVIYWIHGNAANSWADSTPAFGASLAEFAQSVFFIAYFAYRNSTI
jgi:hypothetical protein